RAASSAMSWARSRAVAAATRNPPAARATAAAAIASIASCGAAASGLASRAVATAGRRGAAVPRGRPPSVTGPPPRRPPSARAPGPAGAQPPFGDGRGRGARRRQGLLEQALVHDYTAARPGQRGEAAEDAHHSQVHRHAQSADRERLPRTDPRGGGEAAGDR